VKERWIVSAIASSLIVFACVFGGALFGMFLRAVLPAHHLDDDAKDVIKLGMGLIATMTALVLGLLIATAKGSYDTQEVEVTQLSAKILFLDRTLARYGPETKDVRNLARGVVARAVDRAWPEVGTLSSRLEPRGGADVLYEGIQELSPKNDAQRSFKAQALTILSDVAQTRWLMFQQRGSSFSKLFLVVVVSWLTIIFISFGLYAPRNATVIGTLLVCALSVSGAILMILELDRPFDGLIRISPAQLRDAIAVLGR
jgi:hypothetical protein